MQMKEKGFSNTQTILLPDLLKWTSI